MAEAYSPWRLPATLTASEVSSPSFTSGSSCPVFYPVDSRALGELANNGLPTIGEPAPYIASTPQTSLCPQGWPTELGDQLRVGALVSTGTQAVTFYGRTLGLTGTPVPFSQTVTANSASTLVTATIQMPQGCLLSLDAYAPSGLGAGNVFVLGQLGRTQAGAFIPYQQVLSGQLTGYGVATSAVTASGSTSSGGGGGGCCCEDLSYWNASSTGNWAQDFTPAAGTVMRLVSISCAADTSTTVGNRSVSFWVTAFGGFDVVLWTDANFMGPNEIWYYYFNTGGASGAATTPGGTKYVNQTNPATMWFDSTFYLNFNFNDKKTGDAFTAITAIFETKTCA